MVDLLLRSLKVLSMRRYILTWIISQKGFELILLCQLIYYRDPSAPALHHLLAILLLHLILPLLTVLLLLLCREHLIPTLLRQVQAQTVLFHQFRLLQCHTLGTLQQF